MNVDPELKRAIEQAMEAGFRIGYRKGYVIGYESKAGGLPYNSEPPSGYFESDDGSAQNK